MALIKLSNNGFTMIPEGTTIFKITNVIYDEDFGKMVVDMLTQKGQKHSERFTLLTKNGEVNEGALRAFSYFAKTALNNYSVEEIDESDLVGCYVQADVKHEPYEKRDGSMGKAVRLSNYTVSAGFQHSEAVVYDNVDDFLND